MNKQLVNYNKLNLNKKNIFVFHLTSRGFASEINNMLSAILYCLINGYEFRLSSRYWNSSYKNGWSDYFIEFCEEDNDYAFKNKLTCFSEIKYETLNGKIRGKIDKLFFPKQKTILKSNSTWDAIRNEEFFSSHFSIPELDIDGDIFHAKQIILKMIYRLNPELLKAIAEKDFDSTQPYISIHIRRGDKITTNEAQMIEIENYVESIKKLDINIRNIFIATDDYSTVESFRRLCPDWNIITFCQQAEHGHEQSIFNQKRGLEKKNVMIDLLTDIHYLSNATYFVGTYSSNIGRLVALNLGQERCFSLDEDNIWFPH